MPCERGRAGGREVCPPLRCGPVPAPLPLPLGARPAGGQVSTAPVEAVRSLGLGADLGQIAVRGRACTAYRARGAAGKLGVGARAGPGLGGGLRCTALSRIGGHGQPSIDRDFGRARQHVQQQVSGVGKTDVRGLLDDATRAPLSLRQDVLAADSVVSWRVRYSIVRPQCKQA